MPYYAGRRRRYYGRRLGYYRPWRRYWRQFYRRWRSRRRRRPRRFRVRRFRRRFRGYRRRKALRKRLRRRRIIGPFAIKHFVPPIKRNCVIKGFAPLAYFTRQQVAWPFVNPTSGTFMGGGFGFLDWDLNMLYSESLMKRNKWSRSNYGFDFARFKYAKLKLYRHEGVSYIAKYYQGYKVTDKMTWMDLHPAVLIMDKERVIVAADRRIPVLRRHKPKKIIIKRPPDMTTEWYTMCELGHLLLFRLGISVIDFQEPFQQSLDKSGQYYLSVGYRTPDRRTLRNYQRATGTAGAYLPADVRLWGKSWVTWGGPINSILPYGNQTTWCGNKYPELSNGEKGVMPTLPNRPTGCYGPSEQQYKPAYFLRWYDFTSGHEGDFISGKFMFEFCPNQTRPPPTDREPEPLIDPYWDGLVTGIPSPTITVPLMCSRSSHQSSNLNTKAHIDKFDRTSPASQGFWPIRYNWIYDRGAGNVVYGMYIPKNEGTTSTYKYMYDGFGPGTSSKANFATVRFFEDIPYWLVFFGHSYKTFISYLNQLRPDIINESYGGYGFFAVGIRGFPAEKVASGPFQEGYAPLRYLGSNCEYFANNRPVEETWVKWWRPNQNQPPINNKGEIDYNSWVFCILRDGRTVLYGSSMEGSLLASTSVDSRKYFFTEKGWATLDDIYNIGRSGPFVTQSFHPDVTENVVNLYCYYKFYFQWGGYHQPGHWSTLQDPSKEPCPKPTTAFFEDGDHGTGHYRSKRHITQPGEGPVHPYEVSAQSFIPDRDVSPGGFIRPDAWQRLTRLFSSTALGGSGPRVSGHGTGNKLCSVYSEAARREIPSTTTSTTETTEESSEEMPSSPRAKRVKRHQKESPEEHLSPPLRGSKTGSEGCLPCQKRWMSHPSREQHLFKRLERLQSRNRELQRLTDKLKYHRTRKHRSLSESSFLSL
ncbi:ORF1 [torque teno Delphinidae virus 3]